jgi:phenylacetate-CoA ligase
VLPRSSIPGVDWPPFPDGAAATTLALAWQLEQTQWWSAEKLREHQQLQLRRLLAHAATTTEHYAGRVDADRDLADLPLLTRQELIEAGPRVLSKRYPIQHGAAPETVTSRSTGEPVRVRVPGIVTTFWNAITLRDHAWHRRDLSARLAAIRHTGDQAPPPDGARAAGWGPATADVAPEAPLSVLSVASTTAQQVAWLVREDPAYLVAYPTVLGAIARHLAAIGQRLPSLRQVRTISEALSPDTRALCRDVLGVPLVDTYSAQECGYIALQCPAHEHYHVQSERLVVEILDDDGRPCPPGAIGRVVVTDLHNFATPLVRYELGDFAEVGEPCPCGRGLPVLTRIVGRRRGMLVYPDGRTVWPVFTVACREAAPYLECQLVQDAIDRLRLRVVPSPAQPLDDVHRDALVAALRGSLGPEFRVTIEAVDTLDRSPAGKLEEFVSHVAPPRG